VAHEGAPSTVSRMGIVIGRLGTDAADLLQGYEEGWDLKHLAALRSIAESS